jgi:hypothetical protein
MSPRNRRHVRRVKLRQPIKVRPASPKDGEFEEISETENASKRGIYFMTIISRYFVGMRVYVTLPYTSPASPKSREYLGQVIRVEHTTTEKRGVAVQFL